MLIILLVLHFILLSAFLSFRVSYGLNTSPKDLFISTICFSAYLTYWGWVVFLIVKYFLRG
jgi:hypothetical protein